MDAGQQRNDFEQRMKSHGRGVHDESIDQQQKAEVIQDANEISDENRRAL